MKRMKKLISLLLSCIMVLQLLPLSVFAAESSGVCGNGTKIDSTARFLGRQRR